MGELMECAMNTPEAAAAVPPSYLSFSLLRDGWLYNQWVTRGRRHQCGSSSGRRPTKSTVSQCGCRACCILFLRAVFTAAGSTKTGNSVTTTDQPEYHFPFSVRVNERTSFCINCCCTIIYKSEERDTENNYPQTVKITSRRILARHLYCLSFRHTSTFCKYYSKNKITTKPF